jgi:phosphoribosyl 1,2-cyclic phosphodiesterase
MMNVRFWGVRGSIASPGPETQSVGGNTSCVEVKTDSGTFIFDAGTGLRDLGNDLLRRGEKSATVLLSHFHWDHIQGLPFFVPAYVPGFDLKILGGTHDGADLRAALESQMKTPGFPVSFADLSARISLGHVRSKEWVELAPNVRAKSLKLNHPGGSFGYRLEVGNHSVVYATDTEHYACVDPELVKLAQGADVLIYDAQYTPEEYAGTTGRGPSRVGWGHSTYVAAAEIARAADVSKLVLFHHDPSRNDAQVAEIEARTKTLFANTQAAREGEILALSPERPDCIKESREQAA